MSARSRLGLLLLIMALVVLVTGVITFSLLYRTSLEEARARLVDTAVSQARLIEAVASFDVRHFAGHSLSPRDATLSQIRAAHASYRGFGETGEFTLSERQDDLIVFLLSHRHLDLDNPQPVPWNSELAEPMRRALQGESGTIVGLDYRGEMVLAAHEPVAPLNMGIVAKIDLWEIRSPFVRAGLISVAVALFLIVLGAALFFKVTNPLLVELEVNVDRLEHALAEVKTLRGIVPICSFCKKIRNDEGFWDQVETYVRQHTEANFSHSICPDCSQKHYPDYD